MRLHMTADVYDGRCERVAWNALVNEVAIGWCRVNNKPALMRREG